MVDTHPRANCPCGQPVDPIAGAVAERINRGDLDLSDPWSLPELATSLVMEIVAEQTAALRVELASVTAELDAANDAVTELIGQLDEARADTWRAETVLDAAGERAGAAVGQLELALDLDMPAESGGLR